MPSTLYDRKANSPRVLLTVTRSGPRGHLSSDLAVLSFIPVEGVIHSLGMRDCVLRPLLSCEADCDRVNGLLLSTLGPTRLFCRALPPCVTGRGVPSLLSAGRSLLSLEVSGPPPLASSWTASAMTALDG